MDSRSNNVAFQKGKTVHHAKSKDGTQSYTETRTGNHFANVVVEGNMSYVSPYRNSNPHIMQKKPAKSFLADCCRSISNLFFGKETTPTEKGKRVSLEENPLLGRRRTHISGGTRKGGKRKGGTRTHRNKRVTILDIIDFLNKHPEIKKMIMNEMCPIHKSKQMVSDAHKMIDLIEKYDTNISLEELKMQIQSHS
jgi:hypothetical protein